MRGDDDPRGGGERVRAQAHRHGAGVPAAPAERDLDADHAGDRRDDPERHAVLGEHRPLLDVRLDEARGARPQPAAPRQLPEPERRERLAEADSVGVPQVGLVRLERAADRTAAEDPAAEARALLEPEGDDRERPRAAAARADRLGRVERGEHAERPVEAAAVERRVEVRSAPHLGQRRVGAGGTAVEVARGVRGDLEPRVAHPPADQLERALLSRAQAEAVRAGSPPDLEERVEPGAQARRASRGVEAAWRHRRSIARRPTRRGIRETVAMEWRLLAGVPRDEVARTLEIARRRTFARDEVVFHEGDPADTVHLIESGRAAVHATTRHGQRVTLAVLGPGDAFGELALLEPGARRNATVAAIEPLVTRAIYEADFHRLRRTHPELSEVIIALLSDRVRVLDAQLLDALYLSADLRVRKRLAELAERYEETDGETVIPLRQEDIADLAGTSRATVNRVLREEARRGTVRLTRGRTAVLDRERLLDLLR